MKLLCFNVLIQKQCCNIANWQNVSSPHLNEDVQNGLYPLWVHNFLATLLKCSSAVHDGEAAILSFSAVERIINKY
jgi:hypothetical protein